MQTLGEHDLLSVLSPEVASSLELCAIEGPLLPNLKTLQLWHVTSKFAPFISLFLSPKTTDIHIRFSNFNAANATITSMITYFQKPHHTLREISLYPLPRDATIVAAVSTMVNVINRIDLRCFCVDSPLTEEACEVVYNLTSLHRLWVFVEKDIPPPSLALPLLTDLIVTYSHDSDWVQVFGRLKFEKLTTFTFHSESDQMGRFLEKFKVLASGTSNTSDTPDAFTPNRLLSFRLHTSLRWTPNYSSLHQFTQLTDLVIKFSCDLDCSSTVDNKVIKSLAQTMLVLETLRLGNQPCCIIHIGVTVKGLWALAHRCLHLSTLRIHLQADTLAKLPMTLEIAAAPPVMPGALRRVCVLTELELGKIPVPGGARDLAAMTLLHIFPHIESISSVGGDWEEVMDAIHILREKVGTEHPFSTPLSCSTDTPPDGPPKNNG